SGNIYAVYCSAAGPIINEPGAVWNALSDQSLAGYNQGCPNTNIYFVNNGIFEKLAGTNVTSASIAFTNTGSVLAQSGTIQFSGTGALAGSLQAGGGAGINLSGPYDVTGLTNVQGAVVVTGGLCGTLGTSMTLTGSYVNNNAPLTVATNGVLNVNIGNGNSTYVYTALTNYGTVNWQSGNIYLVYCSAAGPVINEPGAVWNASCDQSLSGYNQGCANSNIYFANGGTFQKLAGSNVTYVGVAFTNTGSLLAQSGTVFLEGGGGLAGNVQTATNAYLEFSSALSGTLSGTVNLLGNLPMGGWLAVATNGVLNINPGNGIGTYVYAPLTNYGTVNWQSGNIYLVTCSGAGPIINEPGAVWNALCDQTVNVYDQGCWDADIYFANAGTLQKSGTSGTTTISI